MKKPERDFSEKPCLVWNERTGEDFSQEEARQRIENVSGFFQVLAE